MISSKLEAAMSLVGIAFLTPYPCSYKSMQEGTSTAGETAARMNPRAKQRAIGNLKIIQENKATAQASEI